MSEDTRVVLSDIKCDTDFFPSRVNQVGSITLPIVDPEFFSELMALDDDVIFEMIPTVIQATKGPMVADNYDESSLMSELSETLRPEENINSKSLSSLGHRDDVKPSRNDCTREGIEERQPHEEERKLSTEELVRLAAAHFIQTSSLVVGDPSKLRLPFGLSLACLTREEIKNVELVSLLMTAAEKVNNQQYSRAKILLKRCYILSSTTGNPVQRVAYYFSHALEERIYQETGKLSSRRLKKVGTMSATELMKALLSNHPVQLAVNNTLPFTQVLQFTSIQAILDNVASAKRIHMIDLSIKHGIQWTFFMQALATRHNCPVDSLTITAVGTSENVLAPIGNRLLSFARSLNLPFEFKMVTVPDMKYLKEDMFELDEAPIVVYSELNMNSLLVMPESLENLMRVIRKLRPCLLTVIDVEAKMNSRSFIKRFTEALFFYSAFFDCLESLMGSSDDSRMMVEGSFFSEGIKSILAAEGSERVIRQVGVCVWRSFFTRFGLMEAELSDWSMYQARILVERFVKDDSCTLEMNGKSLLVGWKGTPLHFVSAWKFQQEDV